MRKSIILGSLLVASLAFAGSTLAADTIPVGHLAAYTGPTSGVGIPFGNGIDDALAYINKHGGINGKQIKYKTVDYSYNAPRAVATYKKWMSSLKPVAIQGWGTADTEALVKFIAKDKVTYISASYSGHLTDPTGKGPKSKSAAPYNFFYGPSYSDACRGLVQWAADDWKAKGKSGKPKFIHMGDNHPYPNAPKAACAAYAKELGFEVEPSIVYSLKPADAKAQCLSLKDSGADYAYLANTSSSNISLLKSCSTVGVKTQFLTNIWGWDENSIKATGAAGDGIAWVVGAATWEDDAPGMKTLREVSKMSDPSGKKPRMLHYIRGVCGTFLMKEAMLKADAMGAITGENIKKGFESMKNFVPAGLEGVCSPSTWTAEDHRGMNLVNVYTSKYNGGDFKMTKLATVEVPRRPEWLGW
ncbi:branched-chain amino acid ABC transporter substrate-binding protein [Geothermobacter hydrogeniphilus]|uniref:Branched-chain amino acid ABC transporter substrate-binding protein n=1 Tax=Geothermobacter hydrogeniphilus TaxID=1969733 RepID=A0A2K2H7R3_9BACT|nr:ABC transporter substrate-binding protein [Geothermobacter hydrogeniphilus]PNU19273.1 branched-chain amino acid ABC transporter substrate-binding protein [Geothermobacter hydrogeniphilus]